MNIYSIFLRAPHSGSFAAKGDSVTALHVPHSIFRHITWQVPFIVGDCFVGHSGHCRAAGQRSPKNARDSQQMSIKIRIDDCFASGY
jgi:hypothetical protein